MRRCPLFPRLFHVKQPPGPAGAVQAAVALRPPDPSCRRPLASQGPQSGHQPPAARRYSPEPPATRPGSPDVATQGRLWPPSSAVHLIQPCHRADPVRPQPGTRRHLHHES